MASSGGRPAASTSKPLIAPHSRQTAASSASSRRYGVCHSASPRLSSATPSTAVAGRERSMPPETTSSPPTAITQTEAETEDCQRNALDQHQADILPAEKVGRLYAQPYQQRQKQDQGEIFSISVAGARTAATLDSSTHGEGSCPPLIATSRASSVSPRVGRLAASAPRQRTEDPVA